MIFKFSIPLSLPFLLLKHTPVSFPTGLKHSYRYGGSPRVVATPGDGVVISEGSYERMSMNGKEVYKFATREVPKVLKEALDAAGLTVDDVDHLLLHQVREFLRAAYCCVYFFRKIWQLYLK